MNARRLILDEPGNGKAGEITITATPEEWVAVINRITQFDLAVEDDSDRLVYHLISAGVCE